MSEDGKNYLKDVSEFGKVLDFITIMVSFMIHFIAKYSWPGKNLKALLGG
uniref:Family 18 glycoside hydrolase n=1 Tax=Phakopsora pachyrhizi TaxID=170000 RepID=A0A0S1MID8_PHAPC